MGSACTVFNNNHCLENYTYQVDADIIPPKEFCGYTKFSNKDKVIHQKDIGRRGSHFHFHTLGNKIESRDPSCTPTCGVVTRTNINNGINLPKFTQCKNAFFEELIKNNKENNFLSYDPINIIKILRNGNKNMNFEENIFEYINRIRTSPKKIINDIDMIIKDNILNIEDKMYIVNERKEKIILNDGILPLKEIKDYLEKVIPIDGFELNEQLKINFGDYNDKNSNILDLSDNKLGKIILDKKEKIKDYFPKCFFFFNFIPDSKIGLLLLLSDNKSKIKFREVLFNQKYNQFYISWTKEKNRGFISVLSFAQEKK